jgi:predicted metalloprotease with PDZ domain
MDMMPHRPGWWLVVLLAAPIAGAPTLVNAQEAAGPEYHLSYASAGTSGVEIRIELPEPLPAPQVLAVPRAVPMGYSEQPYDRFVSNVRAFGADNGALPVERLDGPRWRVGSAGQSIRTLRYEVNLVWMENEIKSAADASKVRPSHVGILGYSIFAYVEGLEERPVSLTATAPERWSVFSTLAPAAPAASRTVTADAADFYALADSQVVMGRHLAVRRVNAKVPLYVVNYAEGTVDVDRIAQLGGQALNAMIEYFGGAPFSHYTIYTEFLKPVTHAHQYGFSMEHLDSGTFFFDAGNPINADSDSSAVRRALYNFAHHIAHSWIPKRCSGEGYFPFSWELAPVIDTIWLSEGFAQYAAMVAVGDVMGVEIDVLVDRRFRSVLDESPPSIRRMSTVELSRIASTRYSEDFRTGRNSFARGGMLAAEMDALIREKSGQKTSLRDGLRQMLEWCGENDRGFRVEQIPAIIQAGSGVDVRAIFEKWMGPQTAE